MPPVPWITTPPDLIEQIVAVLLGNKNQRAFRIRPSRGDGGLDVLVPAARQGYFDDYQIKKFATNLDDSQKRQIVESLKRARDTHNDPSNPFLIETWLLTLPLDPTREQFKWLGDEATNLNVPFKVEWKGLTFLEGLAADYPQVIDYYLRDGKDRLQDSIAALRNLAQLSVSPTGAVLEPADVTERLGNLHQALNRDDPHYRYDFEVTSTKPILFERPYLVASVAGDAPNGYVTFHVYARYPDATEDRPIPITFNISLAELTPEALEDFNNMLRYGTPVSLPESAVTDINIDMPAGLGLEHGSGSISLGPASAESDQLSRVVWAILPPDTMEPLAQLTLQMEAATRGMSGGTHVHGVDTTGVVAVTIRVGPPGDGNRAVSLSVAVIDPAGKPVGQVLPGLRFLSRFSAPGRLAFGPEYGLLTVADGFPLPESPQIIPATALEYAESLQAISQRSGKVIELPEFADVTEDDYSNIIGIGKVLRGERVPLTWSSITARVRPGVDPKTLAARPLMTSQNLTATISGTQYDLGQFYTYLLSTRIEGDLRAEPGPDGNLPIAIVPGDSSQAIMTSQPLTPEEAQELTADAGDKIGGIITEPGNLKILPYASTTCGIRASRRGSMEVFRPPRSPSGQGTAWPSCSRSTPSASTARTIWPIGASRTRYATPASPRKRRHASPKGTAEPYSQPETRVRPD